MDGRADDTQVGVPYSGIVAGYDGLNRMTRVSAGGRRRPSPTTTPAPMASVVFVRTAIPPGRFRDNFAGANARVHARANASVGVCARTCAGAWVGRCSGRILCLSTSPWWRAGNILGSSSNCMDKNKIPHVCFKVAFTSEGNLGDELSRILEEHLSLQFDSVEVMKKRVLPVWAIALKVNQIVFTLCFTRSRYENGEWILFVRALDAPTLLGRLHRFEQTTCTSELMLISQNIHSMLVGISGISAIRWYFEDKRVQSQAVDTPDRLPWA